MTTGVVTFDAAAFKARYPEFTSVADDALTAYFAEACLYLSNADTSRVSDIGERGLLLNMIVAHLSALYSGANGADPSGLVGRIDQASEGAVSVHADMGAVPNTAAWYMQTKYGASYWSATAKYRQMQYVPGRSNNQVFPGYVPGGLNS